MILNRRINLIWYGRGNVQTGCDSFALHGNAVASAAISEVYCVTEGSGNTTFEENTWKASKPSQAVGFTKLECGNLYVVVLNDQQIIDIPEAVVVYGGESVNPADIVSVLPDNDGGPAPDPDPEPSGDCVPSGYTALTITSNSTWFECTIDGETNTITTQMDLVGDTKIYYKGTLTPAGDDSSSFHFKISGNDTPIMTWVGFATLDFTFPIYFESATLGCYKSTEDNQASATELIFAKVGEVDERTPTPSPSHTVTPDVPVDAQATCFADNAAGYKMVYEAPAEATPASEVTTDNVKVYKSGSEDALTDAEPNPSDEGAVVLKNAMIQKAIETEEGSSSKHSFCIWFDVTIQTDASGLNDPVWLKALGNTAGIDVDDTDFNLQATSPEQLASDGSGLTNVKFNLVGSPKIWVESSDTCVTTSDEGDGVVSFNF
jgi:hypothetical protein